MTIVKGPVPISVSAPFVGMAALWLACGPLWRTGAALAFAALHEAGHLIAMAAFGARPGRVHLAAGGMRIERPPALRLSFPREIAVAFAGPAASLLLAGLFALAQQADLSLLNLGFALFNLLPVRRLDGGRALYFLLCKRLPERTASRLVLAASLLSLFAATAAATYACLTQGLSLPLLIAVGYLALCV